MTATRSAYRSDHRAARRAITLVELLVVFVILGILVCLLLPALVGARGRTRRDFCEQKLGKLGLALHAYESDANRYPAGVINPDGPILSEPRGIHLSWVVQMLPYIDEQVEIGGIDPRVGAYAEQYDSLRQTMLPAITCPAATSPPEESDYAACHHLEEAPIDGDNEGVFYLNSETKRGDVLDGLSHTLFFGEKRSPAGADLGWMSGTRATLRNTGHPPKSTYGIEITDPQFVGGFGSWHVGITHISKGDATVSAVADGIDPIVYHQLGGRRDGTQQAALLAEEDAMTFEPLLPAAESKAKAESAKAEINVEADSNDGN